MRRLKIFSANIYYKNDGRTLGDDYEILGNLRAHSGGIQEYVKGSIRGMKKTEPTAPDRIRARPGFREVQTFVRSNKNLIDEGRLKASDLVPNDGLGHDRWIDYAVYRWGNRKIMHITTHRNAGIQGPEGRPLLQLPRTRQYAIHAETLEDVIEASEKLGYDVFVTEDGNYKRPTNPTVRLWEYSPQRIPGYVSVENKIDYIHYNPKRWKLTHKRIIKPKGSDHDFLYAEFKAI